MLYEFFVTNLIQVTHAWPRIAVMTGFFFLINLYLLKTSRTRHESIRGRSLACIAFLALSQGLILAMTLFGREPGAERHFRLLPFWSYRDAIFGGQKELGIQIISNFLLFVPLGAALPLNFRWIDRSRKVLLVCALFSIGVELVQGIAGMGLCETDDMIGNTLGGILGFQIWRVSRRMLTGGTIASEMRSGKK